MGTKRKEKTVHQTDNKTSQPISNKEGSTCKELLLLHLNEGLARSEAGADPRVDNVGGKYAYLSNPTDGTMIFYGESELITRKMLISLKWE